MKTEKRNDRCVRQADASALFFLLFQVRSGGEKPRTHCATQWKDAELHGNSTLPNVASRRREHGYQKHRPVPNAAWRRVAAIPKAPPKTSLRLLKTIRQAVSSDKILIFFRKCNWIFLKIDCFLETKLKVSQNQFKTLSSPEVDLFYKIVILDVDSQHNSDQTSMINIVQNWKAISRNVDIK